MRPCQDATRATMGFRERDIHYRGQVQEQHLSPKSSTDKERCGLGRQLAPGQSTHFSGTFYVSDTGLGAGNSVVSKKTPSALLNLLAQGKKSGAQHLSSYFSLAPVSFPLE